MDKQFNTVKKLLMSHKKELSRPGSRHLAIFGSTARDEAKKTSDIDILVDFDTKGDLFGFIDLKFYLEDLLDCEVDLVTKQALHPALKKRILSQAKEIF